MVLREQGGGPQKALLLGSSQGAKGRGERYWPVASSDTYIPEVAIIIFGA